VSINSEEVQTATFAVHCGNGFDADITPIKKSFKPIQCCLQSMGTDMQGRECTTLISGAREVLMQKFMLIAVVGMSPSSRWLKVTSALAL